MKPLDELDHYEVLEIPPGAGFEDIERAYRMTRAAYTDGSMALYSIFNHDDAAVIRTRIDEAYRILADPEVRAKYDAEVGISTADGVDPTPAARVAGSAAADARLPATGVVASAQLPAAIRTIDAVDAGIEEAGEEVDGAALRRARLDRGFELDQVADVTKISVTYLVHIEKEEFDKLPATVYIRGFVHAYARAIGLDADRVAVSYMGRVSAVRNPVGSSPRTTSS